MTHIDPGPFQWGWNPSVGNRYFSSWFNIIL